MIALPQPQELQTPALLQRVPDSYVWRRSLDGRPVVCKLYRHRPLRSCFTAPRVQREFAALALLHCAGIAVPAPLHWRVGADAEHGRHELLVMDEIVGAIDLREAFRRGGTPSAPPDLRPLFAEVAAMHGHGVQHGALALRNVLIVPSRPRFWLIDFARTQRFAGSIVGTPAGDFDLRLLLQGLARWTRDDAGLAQALGAYPGIGAEAAAWVAQARRAPMSGLQLNLHNARAALASRWSRR